MQRGTDKVIEATPVAEAHRAAPRRPATTYVVRADLQAGTVSVLWPAGATRVPPRRAAPRRRRREGRSSP